MTVLRVVVEGEREGRRVRHTWDLLDRYDRATRTTSMARTTGYTCTAMVRAVASGVWTRPGIIPMELAGGDPATFDLVMRLLAERGIVFRETVSEEGAEI